MDELERRRGFERNLTVVDLEVLVNEPGVEEGFVGSEAADAGLVEVGAEDLVHVGELR